MDGDDIGVSLELVSAGDIHRKGEVGEKSYDGIAEDDGSDENCQKL